jgi:hypothetical protein
MGSKVDYQMLVEEITLSQNFPLATGNQFLTQQSLTVGDAQTLRSVALGCNPKDPASHIQGIRALLPTERPNKGLKNQVLPAFQGRFWNKTTSSDKDRVPGLHEELDEVCGSEKSAN